MQQISYLLKGCYFHLETADFFAYWLKIARYSFVNIHLKRTICKRYETTLYQIPLKTKAHEINLKVYVELSTPCAIFNNQTGILLKAN